MIRGIYAAATGMLVGGTVQDVLAANIANADTPGFRGLFARVAAEGDLPLVRLEEAGTGRVAVAPVGPLGLGATVVGVVVSGSPGPLRETGRELDVALEGPGFLVVEGAGEPLYTRAGHLVRGVDGSLQMPDGHRVLGDAGPIVVGPGPVQIDADGTVRQGDAVLGRLRRVDFPNPAGLVPQGAGRYAAGTAGAPTEAATPVRQGYLEGSGVQPVEALVDLITAVRAYEAAQRAVLAHDQALALAVRDVGQVSGRA
ncbi:MAG: flagellar hook-basal body protein [Clostridia bacterium]|nr:flagellar hook-basal body protein [Clostridia bacterium]